MKPLIEPVIEGALSVHIPVQFSHDKFTDNK